MPTYLIFIYIIFKFRIKVGSGVVSEFFSGSEKKVSDFYPWSHGKLPFPSLLNLQRNRCFPFFYPFVIFFLLFENISYSMILMSNKSWPVFKVYLIHKNVQDFVDIK